MQALFVGAGITIANFSLLIFQHLFSVDHTGATSLCDETVSAIPTWMYYSFFLGALASIGTVLLSVWKTPEIPPSDKELSEINTYQKETPHPLIQIVSVLLVILALPITIGFGLGYLFPSLFENINLLVIIILIVALIWLYFLYRQIKKNTGNKTIKTLGDALGPFIESADAIGGMPKMMWKLAAVYFFQWYALFVYWQFITPMLRVSLLGQTNADTEKYDSIIEACKAGGTISAADTSFAQDYMLISEQALAQTGLMNGTYNFVTMIVALALVPFARKYGSRNVYVVSLVFAGLAMLSMPYIHNEYALLIPMILFGIGWAAMMGIPYAMVSKVIPEEKRGVYMGIVNMMIVIPMLIQTVTFGPIIKNVLNNDAVNAILFGGVFFIIAALLALRLTKSVSKSVQL
jgi:maltose/moltooligosaccharide transporter